MKRCGRFDSNPHNFETPGRRACLAAEQSTDPLLAPLLKAGVRPLPSRLRALGTLRSADQFGTLVTGQATFSFWMALPSPRIKHIHVALPEHQALGSAFLSRFADGFDLRVDEPRYTYHYRAPLLGEKHVGRFRPLDKLLRQPPPQPGIRLELSKHPRRVEVRLKKAAWASSPPTIGFVPGVVARERTESGKPYCKQTNFDA